MMTSILLGALLLSPVSGNHAAFGGAATVAVLPADIRIGVQYASWTKEESKQNLSETIQKAVSLQLHRAGSQMVDPGDVEDALKKLSSQVVAEHKPSDFEALDAELKADYLVLIELDRVGQSNRSAAEIASDISKSAGQTKVEVRAFVYSKSAHMLVAAGDSVLKGWAKGQFFGTTDPYELSGSPEDKAIFIRLENKRRMDAIAKAIWAGAKSTLEHVIVQPDSRP